ncbi:AAA family ATPase [Ruminobacter sp. RM87]|uniref:AAA family ATPase n=1 Tax=Ruminobacter sp. RM87 TaxID=1200567 RepID=UPI0004E182EC|nr:AAA family ATPase [Ruminobacter sp. RM87]
MLKPIGIGAELFHELIESNSYYVDKTPFIKTIFEENTSKVMLITRPRRFGKTLTMSTFYDFLALDLENPDDVSRQEKWFKDTKIFEDKEFCAKYMGKFPVIFVSFKTIVHQNFNDAYNQFATLIYKLALQFEYLAASKKLSDKQKEQYANLVNYEKLVDRTDKSFLTGSLQTLSCLLKAHHKVSPMLLIDEYDVPIAKAAYHGYYEEMINLISPFYNDTLKTNPYLGRAVLTGCLRAAKESIFTGLNNLQICSVLDTGTKDISKGIGFTKEETQEVLSYYGLNDYYDEVRNNYDGYYFGTNHMYCPWDVMSFCRANYEKLNENRNLIKADNYWINTSGNDVIEEFMGFIRSEDVDKMQDLLDGKSITTEVRTSLCYGDLKNHNVNDFWTLLLYTGYLTFDSQYRSATKNEYRLYIPNEEIKDCFKSKIMDFFKTNPEMRNSTGDLVKGLFEGNAEEVETKLNALLMKYVSIRDFATNAPKENYYHGFINGLLASGTSYMEEHKSNTESGDGYADIIAASKSSDSVAVLELKQTDRPFGARVVSAGRALEQILEKRYADVFIDDPSVKNIYAYGICFYKKICSVQVKKLK